MSHTEIDTHRMQGIESVVQMRDGSWGGVEGEREVSQQQREGYHPKEAQLLPPILLKA